MDRLRMMVMQKEKRRRRGNLTKAGTITFQGSIINPIKRMVQIKVNRTTVKAMKMNMVVLLGWQNVVN